ncbi:MAG: RNA 2',3'-cyclic phosphodiesterase [Ardenticatenaceae bacterium]|nr:RNA 2',3'-cyclic phosphodiesterase [Ardenticatenaceae bacterium]
MFIAIALPEDVRAVLGQVNDRLAAQVPPRAVRWVKPELMHVTLRFLGDTAVSLIPTIAAELDRAAAQQPKFQLTVKGLGCFPNRKRPRVIWAGLQGDVAQADALAAAINAFLSPMGWEVEERPFQPHLTLGRVNDSRKVQQIDWGMRIEEKVVAVTAVHLIESQLRPSGPVYTVRHTSHLA